MKRSLRFSLPVLLCLSLFLSIEGAAWQPGKFFGVSVVKGAPLVQAEQPIPDTGMATIYLPLVSTPQPVAFHRSGQTFLSWPERPAGHGEVYRIYRSNQPITPDNLPQATFLAEVGRDSARFYANRYRDLSTGVWGPRYTDRLVIETDGSPVQRGWGLLVWTPDSQDFGGATGGTGYYAISVTPPGEAESFYPNMVAGPVSEAVAEPLPVEITSPSISIGEGGHVYIQYMDLRSWNPTFHAPNATNDYYGLDPADPDLFHSLQYAYDYAIYAPNRDLCGGNIPSQIPVFFHLHGWRDNAVPPEEGYRSQDRLCAYGIYPIDVTDTWYFGFAQGNDYRLRTEPAAGDVIVNYTEQRILRMLYDLMRNPPGPAVDQQRIYVAGQSMGGTGSLAFAERYANVFAAAYASQPMTNFRTAGTAKSDWTADASVKWGRPELNLPIAISAPAGWADQLQEYNGVGVWDWQDLGDSAAAANLKSRLWDEMTPLGVVHGSKDDVVLWSTQGQPFYAAFQNSHRPWGGLITANPHQWEYYRGLPPSLADLGKSQISAYRPFWNLQVIRDETVPGLSNLSGNSPIPPAGAGDVYNQTIKWSSSWDPWDVPPVDVPNRWQISLCSVAAGSLDCGTGEWQTVDVTPRRVQHFQIIPGKVYTWQNRRATNDNLIGTGTVTADGDGLITVTGFRVSPKGNRLVITSLPSQPDLESTQAADQFAGDLR
ncbi:MAG TPA: prolyl oligopeptidase family serine peptidase [Anaerolineales bacterium]